MKYCADFFYMILFNILPEIIQKNQIELMKYEEKEKINKNALNQLSNFNNNQNILHMNAFYYPNDSALHYPNNISNNNTIFPFI